MKVSLCRRALVVLALAAAAGCLVVPVGTVGVTVQSEPAVAAAAPVVAERLAERLGGALDDLLARRGALPALRGPLFRPAARELIAQTERELLAALADPDLLAGLEVDGSHLAPLRDYVSLEAEAALAAIGKAGDAQGLVLARPALRLAVRSTSDSGGRGAAPVFAQLSRRPVDEKSALDRFFGAILSLRRRAGAGDLQTTLCVVSRPKGGEFEVFPASAQDRARRITSVGRLANLWRGTYSFTVHLDPADDITGINLDLLNPPSLTLECRAGQSACSERVGLQACGGT